MSNGTIVSGLLDELRPAIADAEELLGTLQTIERIAREAGHYFPLTVTEQQHMQRAISALPAALAAVQHSASRPYIIEQAHRIVRESAEEAQQ